MTKLAFKRISRNKMILLRLQHSTPHEIYGQLLTIAKYKDYAPGWVAHKFREIFGKWPAPSFVVEPIPPDSDLLSWLAAERRKFGLRKAREEAKQVPPWEDQPGPKTESTV